MAYDKITVDIERVIEDIGVQKLLQQIIFYYPEARSTFLGDRSPAELADILKQTMSSEALAELKAALS
jgi:hypothetical protein